jgi:hypothetical protein
MSATSPNWFRELFKDKITIDLQAFGGLLDGTMISGDLQAGTVKFPIVGGQTTVYELTGAIQQVPVSNPGLSTVTLTLRDYEASEWWRTQDAYKAGASEQDALKKLIAMAIRRKRDGIKFDAVKAYYDANTGSISTIGDGTARISPEGVETARAALDIYGDAEVDDEVFLPVPAMWMSQLELYQVWNNTQYGAGVSDVFMKAQRTRMKKVRGVNYIVCPDSYFRIESSTKWESFMWRKSAFGAETPYNNESPTLTPVPTMEGTPWLAKANISGAAVGILTKGVKRVLFTKNTDLTRV